MRNDARFEAALERDWEREKAALERAKTTDREKLTPEHFIDVKQFRFRAVREDEHSDELTAALLNNPEVATVYADWFEERGNPRARFIRESLACERAVTEDERMLAFPRWADVLHEHAALLLAPLDDDFDDVRITWKHGFPTSLHVMSNMLPLVQEHPAYRLLRELRVDGPFEREPVKHAFPGLRSLWLDNVELDASELDLLFPQLETLGLAAYWLQVGRLRFSQLRELSLRTTALLPSHVSVLRNIPKLESLALVEDDGSGCEADDYKVIFELKSLRRLRLSVLEIDRLCERLARLKLDVLDLSSSPLTEAGAEAMLRHAREFASIGRIDVRDTMLREEMRNELRRALPNVVSD